MSVFDSGFVLGDGVWEGLRVHKGRIAFLDAHLDRLYEGAKAIAMDIGLTREALTRRLYETLDANGMDGRRPCPADGDARACARRPIRTRASWSRRATIVIIPEYKEPLPAIVERGHHACSPSMSAAAIRPCRTRSSIRIRS